MEIHRPIHAIWFIRIEKFFCILQRKIPTPKDFPDLQGLQTAIIQFQASYDKIAKPFNWKYTKDHFNKTLARKVEPSATAALEPEARRRTKNS
jgi:hypothetical protein